VIRRIGPLVVALLTTAACTVGPDYKRPPVSLPGTFRGTEPTATGLEHPFADQKWWEVFQDEQLQTLIRAALQQNYDARIGAVRVLEAQAQLGITRADQFPQAAASAAMGRERLAATGQAPAVQANVFDVEGSARWELDFWGRFRRATEAARAELAATEWGRRAILTTVVADVAGAYFQLRAIDLDLTIAQGTLASRQESLRLTQVRARGGATSDLDVRQAEQLVFGATATIVDLQRQAQQQENLISILLGNNPGPITRGRELTDEAQPPDVPPGVPSALLQRRPDIQQAEQLLIAANANIGVARAAYFPQITLTGIGGSQSAALSDLFKGPAGFWSVGGALTQPIFDGGRIKSNVRLTAARRDEAVLAYQQTIQQSLRDVSDALVAYRRGREFREQQERLEQSSREARRLTSVRYEGGATSYLEVLDSETRLFSAQLDLAQARLNELLALVQIYRALGGGWQ
jgi:outer membrane protein, multidrug efflux system